jgi:hypothetical protein
VTSVWLTSRAEDIRFVKAGPLNEPKVTPVSVIVVSTNEYPLGGVAIVDDDDVVWVEAVVVASPVVEETGGSVVVGDGGAPLMMVTVPQVDVTHGCTNTVTSKNEAAPVTGQLAELYCALFRQEDIPA